MDDSMVGSKAFSEWLHRGLEMGWVSEPFCSTHDVDPLMTAEEQQEWEDGGDPCCHVLRLVV